VHAAADQPQTIEQEMMMRTKLQSWWKQLNKPRLVITSFLAILCVLLILIALGYVLDWSWTGLIPYNVGGQQQPGKSLWDWLQLLIIPAVLALGGYLFNYSTNMNERNTADKQNEAEQLLARENQHKAVLQDYIGNISELLLHEKLRDSEPEDEVRTIARVRTLTVLPRLDPQRKRILLQFLQESKLIERDKSVISLSGADLSRSNLKEAILNMANLSQANLSGADLELANLWKVMLWQANLAGANLSLANLSNSDLHISNLKGAKLHKTNFVEATLTGSESIS
jgi:uncharacterized protein YjbI with pentapeptide repeats